MPAMAIIWLIFGILFLLLSVFHLFLALGKIHFLKIPDRFENTGASIKILGQDLDQPVKDLISQLNKFIADFKKANFRANLAAAIGYFAASGTAFFSLYLIGK